MVKIKVACFFLGHGVHVGYALLLSLSSLLFSRPKR